MSNIKKSDFLESKTKYKNNDVPPKNIEFLENPTLYVKTLSEQIEAKMRYQIGQEVFVIAFVTDEGINFTNTFPFINDKNDLCGGSDIYIEKLTVTERHFVRVGKGALKKIVHDGYILQKEDKSFFGNQYPNATYDGNYNFIIGSLDFSLLDDPKLKNDLTIKDENLAPSYYKHLIGFLSELSDKLKDSWPMKLSILQKFHEKFPEYIFTKQDNPFGFSDNLKDYSIQKR